MLYLNLYPASDFKFGDVWNINLLLQTLQAMHNKTPVRALGRGVAKGVENRRNFYSIFMFN